MPNVSFCEDERGVYYKPWVYDPSKDYFTMVVTTDGNVTWTGTSTGTSSNKLSYSTDNGATWSTASSSITISVNEGNKILWKGITTPVVNSYNEIYGIGKFGGDTNVRYSVEGNVMSLLFGDNFKGQTSLVGKNYAFHSLFNGNTNITSAENLSLPVIILIDSCYNSMFSGCTNLTIAPELPSTTLTDSCYSLMFYNCTSLNSIKCLATKITAGTDGWLSGVAPSGTFTKAASMTSWTTGKNGIPDGWTVVDAA